MPLLTLLRPRSSVPAGFVQLLADPGRAAFLPEISVDVAFDSNPRDYPQIWTSVTDDVRSLSTTPRGRQPLADRSEAAHLTLVLDNSERKYDATNAAGVYFGKLRPNKRVRIRARWGGVIYPVGEWLVDDWPQTWPGQKDAVVTLQATDKFKMLSRFTVPTSFSSAQQLSGALIEAILDAAGQTAAERNVDVGNSEIVGFNTPVTLTGCVLTSGSAVVTVSSTALLAADMPVSGASGVPAGATILSVDSGTQITLSANATATVTETLTFAQANPDSPGDGLSVAQKTSDSERGLLFVDADGTWRFQNRNVRVNTVPVATFGDSAFDGELPYVDIVPVFTELDIANDIHVTLPDQAETVSTDSTSQDENGPISLSIDTYLADRVTAQAIGDFELSKRKDAATRIDTLVIDGSASPEALWPVLLALKISDHLLVVRRPPGGGDPQLYDCFVENVAHAVRPDQWIVTLQLSPADTAQYWVLGTSVLGTDTRLAV